MYNKYNFEGMYSYLDILMRERKYKLIPTTLYRKTCPICDSKRGNVYYSNRLDKYICKKCMDNFLSEKGGE